MDKHQKALRLLKELHGRNQELEQMLHEPIAIVSASVRLPGGVESLDQYWEVLDQGQDLIGPFPQRWQHLNLFDPNPKAKGKSYIDCGGFLEGIDLFDPGYFGITPKEANAMDPSQRIMLEMVVDLFEEAGIELTHLSSKSVGVYLGYMGSDYGIEQQQNLQDINGYLGTGTAASVLSGRIAYTFGLQGPAITIDTACSSSLVAIHQACETLRLGKADMAIAGGITLMIEPTMFVEFSRLGGLAKRGRCRSFAQEADGAVWSEGAGLVLLKRLSKAIEDQDRILGVIKGSAVNQDGSSQGLTAPHGPSQVSLMRSALQQSGCSKEDISLIEAHGTGTVLGDEIEAQSILEVYGSKEREPLFIGSSKSNFGHSQAAAGVAGLIKCVLAMKHARMPKTLHCQNPHQHTDWESGSLKILQEHKPWPETKGRRRRASISSFGISGTNAHLVVEEPPAEISIEKQKKPLKKTTFNKKWYWLSEKPTNKQKQHWAIDFASSKTQKGAYPIAICDKKAPWMREHTIFQQQIVPAAAMLEFITSVGASQGFDKIQSLSFKKPLVFSTSSIQCELRTQKNPDNSLSFKIIDSNGIAYAEGLLTSFEKDATTLPFQNDHFEKTTSQSLLRELYQDFFAQIGCDFSPNYQRIKQVFLNLEAQKPYVDLELDPLADDLAGSTFSPIILDSIFHAIYFLVRDAIPKNHLLLPTAIKGFACKKSPQHKHFARCTLDRYEKGTACVQISIFDSIGSLIGRIDSIEAKATCAKSMNNQRPKLPKTENESTPLIYSSYICEARKSSAKIALGKEEVYFADEAGDPAQATPIRRRVIDLERLNLGDQPLTEKLLVFKKTLLACKQQKNPEIVLLTRSYSSKTPLKDSRSMGSFFLCFAQENPSTQCTWIEITDPESEAYAQDQLYSASILKRRHIHISDGKIQDWAFARSNEGGLGASHVEGPVLLTGATGGVGQFMCQYLAKQHGVREFYLLSRSAESTALPWVQALQDRYSAKCFLSSVDLSSFESLAQWLASTPKAKQIKSIFHLSGVSENKLIEHCSKEHLERVFAGKVNGLENLLKLAKQFHLKRFVTFSSLVSVLGNQGQSAYAAANQATNTLIEKTNLPNCQMQAYLLGPCDLKTGGMLGALNSTQKDRIKKSGFDFLDESSLSQMLAQAFAYKEKKLAIAAFNKEWTSYGEQPLYTAPKPTAGQENDFNSILKVVTKTICKLIEAGPDFILEPDTIVHDLGLDSVMALDLSEELSGRWSLDLAPTFAYDHSTPKAMARSIYKLLEPIEVELPATTTPRQANPTEKAAQQIAIIAMNCRLPGSIDDPEDFWEALQNGEELISSPPRRWDEWKENLSIQKALKGGFIDAAEEFDAGFFGIAAPEAQSMDPQQRVLLEKTQELLEDAGYGSPAQNKETTGVFLGCMGSDYSMQKRSHLNDFNGYRGTGNSLSILSGRVAYCLGLKGPAISIDTACSSSSVAIHLACQSLKSGECSMAIAGGITIMSSPLTFLEFENHGVLSEDSTCRSFAAGANGTVWSEGCGLVLLKPLEKAIADKDNILGVIEGSAINQDGRSQGLTAPNGQAQASVIERCLQDANLSPEQVDVIEAHGTGTKLGDPIELQALQAAYGAQRNNQVLVGSVKSNLGHTQAAAGVIGLIKMVLSLQKRMLPQSLHALQPTPLFDWQQSKLSLLNKNTAWSDGKQRRRAGISSFALSGTNSHIIVAEPPVACEPVECKNPPLLLISAPTTQSLAKQFKSWVEFLASHSEEESLYALAHQARKRKVHAHKKAVHASSAAALGKLLAKQLHSEASFIGGENLDKNSAIALAANAYLQGEFSPAADLFTLHPQHRAPRFVFSRTRFWEQQYSQPGPLNSESGYKWFADKVQNKMLCKGEVSLRENDWLRDHQVFGKTVIPATYLLYLIKDALNDLGQSGTLEEITLEKFAIIHSKLSWQLEVLDASQSLENKKVALYCQNSEGNWEKSLSAAIATGADLELMHHAQIPQFSKDTSLPTQARSIYLDLEKLNLCYGKRFQGLHGDIHIGTDHQTCWGEIQISKQNQSNKPGYHPTAFLDSGFHLFQRMLFVQDGFLFLPHKIGKITISKELPEQAKVFVKIEKQNAQSVVAHILWIHSGEWVAKIEDLVLSKVDRNDPKNKHFHHQSHDNPPTESIGQPSTWVQKLQQETGPQQKRIVFELLQDILCQILEIDDRQILLTTTEYIDLGVDSLLAVDFHEQLVAKTQLSIEASFVFDYPTLGKTCDLILESIAEIEQEHAKPSMSQTTNPVPLETEELLALLDKRLGE